MRFWVRIVVAVLAVGLLGPIGPASGDGPPPDYVEREATFTGRDGVELAAIVATPAKLAPGVKPPLLVVPAGFATTEKVQRTMIRWFAGHGYVAMTYASRGFPSSKGLVDIAGPQTVSDVSTAIDWAGQNTVADTSRVGLYGQSYSASQIMLAAAEDPRVKAVDAFNGWADFLDSFYPNNTRASIVTDAVLATAKSMGKPGPSVAELEKAYRADQMESLRDFSNTRSATAHLDLLNARGVAVQIHHSYQDSLFPPVTTVDFFEKLTAPKRMFMTPGDHAAYLLLSQNGMNEPTWPDTLEWFDKYIKGSPNGVDRKPSVVLASSNGWETVTAPTWQQVPERTETWYATRPPSLVPLAPTGGLQDKPADPWQTTILGGMTSLGDVGIPFLSAAGVQTIKRPPIQIPALIQRSTATVFQGQPRFDRPLIAGTPRVSLDFTPQTGDLTVIAYLLEVTPLGTAGMITHRPYSLRGVTPGQVQHLAFDLDPVVWRVAPGNSVALVLATSEMRYASRTPAGTLVTIGSSQENPVSLSLPVRS